MKVARILLLIAGIVLVLIGAVGFCRQLPAVPFVIWGFLLIIGSVFERGRYQQHSSETAPMPDPDEEETGEVFSDPTTGQQMRVLYNRRTGERRYVKR